MHIQRHLPKQRYAYYVVGFAAVFLRHRAAAAAAATQLVQKSGRDHHLLRVPRRKNARLQLPSSLVLSARVLVSRRSCRREGCTRAEQPGHAVHRARATITDSNWLLHCEV